MFRSWTSKSSIDLRLLNIDLVYDSQIKSSKNALIQLQQSIQNLASRPEEGWHFCFSLISFLIFFFKRNFCYYQSIRTIHVVIT